MKPSGSTKRVVAAVHAASVFMNKDASIDKAVGLIEKAGEQKIDLLVFPEVFVPGYPYFMMCYPPLAVAEAHMAYVDNSVEVPGPEIAKVQQACKRASVAIVFGVSERLAGARTCFISQVFIDADGALLGVHRKLQPTYMERIIFGQGGGATLNVFNTSLGRVGGLCCWEHTMNLARQEMIAQGEQIHAACWPSLSTIASTTGGKGPDVVNEFQIEAMVKNHAMTAQCFVVSACLTIDQGCLDWMEQNLGPQKFVSLGGGWSAVIHPFVKVIGGPHSGVEEKFVAAEIDLDDIKRLKIWVDSAGHYSRPEVVRHHVNRRPIWHDEGAGIRCPTPIPCPEDEEDQPI